MRRFLAALLLGMFVVPTLEAQDAKKDLKLLAGDWKPIRLVTQEKEEDAKDDPNLRIRIEGDKLLLVRDGEAIKGAEFRIKLDPSTDPKLIDVTLQDGRVIEGIYKLEKKRWTICLYTETALRNRPIAFEASSANVVLLVLGRDE